MFERSPPQQLAFVWSAEGSPASRTASPESDAGPQTSDTSGPTTRASSAKQDRPSSSSRMCQGCARPSCVGCWSTLPSSGSMRNGRLSAQALSAPPIAAIASGSLLPTLTASSYGSNQGGSAGRSGQPKRYSLDAIAKGWLPTPLASDNKGGTGPRRDGGPRLNDFEKTWLPTPTVSGEWNTRSASPRSGDGLATAAGNSIRLREWMMGAPEEWTLVDGKRPSETE